LVWCAAPVQNRRFLFEGEPRRLRLRHHGAGLADFKQSEYPGSLVEMDEKETFATSL
jgi:hypothetical protein